MLKLQDLHSVGGCHGVLALSMAFKIVNNLRMQVVRAILTNLPTSRRRWWNASITRLQRFAATVAMYSAARTPRPDRRRSFNGPGPGRNHG